MAASRATDTAAAISSKPAPDNVRRHAGTVLRPFPTAAEVPADRIPSAQETPARQIDARDSFAVTALADIIDRSLHAAVARFTAGFVPGGARPRLFGLGHTSHLRAGQAITACG